MGYRFCLTKRRRINGGGRVVFGFCLFISAALFAGQVIAMDMRLLGKPLSLNGYVNQGVQFGVSGDSYATMQGFQQALMQALLEVEYHPAKDVKVFVTGQLVKDWAYDILDSDDDWKFRRFDKSRSEMSLYSDYEDWLKECHVTWTPGAFNIRVGKQILSWGRMTGVRIMDQINPRDLRRGFADVEFETSIIPIWLAKVEYFTQKTPEFINDLGFEFTFNPNADFIPQKVSGLSNEISGIWSADVLARPGIRLGAPITDYEEPDKWDSDGYEYMFRIKGLLSDNTYFTLNYFDGVSNRSTNRSILQQVFDPFRDDKNNSIMHSLKEGYYPDQKFAGFTLSREFESLNVKWLGGIAPLLRCEALYEFDSAFESFGLSNRATGKREEYEKHDAIYWGMSVDWKFKWNLINPTRYIALSTGFNHRHIRDYPSNYVLTEGGPFRAENQYGCTASLRTQYLHQKLTPFIFYKRDVHSDVADVVASGSVKYDLWLFKLTYEPNERWKYAAALYMVGNDGYEALGIDHQDNLSFTVSYSF